MEPTATDHAGKGVRRVSVTKNAARSIRKSSEEGLEQDSKRANQPKGKGREVNESGASAGRRRRNKKGMWLGGTVPLGYEARDACWQSTGKNLRRFARWRVDSS